MQVEFKGDWELWFVRILEILEAGAKLHYLVRQYPFTEVHLRDDDIKMDLSEHNGPEDRLAIIVTEPLTTNENWTALEPGQFMTFVEGCPQAEVTLARVPSA